MDIDGVLTENQMPISGKIFYILNRAMFHYHVYLVTGNSFLKARDILLNAPFCGIFSNSGHDLRDHCGKLIWTDSDVEPLPCGIEEDIRDHLSGFHPQNNHIEWRTPSFVNVSTIGRFATPQQRLEHSASWRDSFIEKIKSSYDVDAVKGGAVSVDIYSRGADKARAARYVNYVLDCDFIFIGDKTSPGGNDYPIVSYCEKNKKYSNNVLTTTGIENTIEMIEEFL